MLLAQRARQVQPQLSLALRVRLDQRAQLGRLVQILLLQDLQAQRVQLVLADKTAMSLALRVQLDQLVQLVQIVT